ncbi:MAG: hypothetical protein PUD80_03220 [Firmicutes bacterium]|nr:hypothetical protein [Bacillota bacterium]
MCVNAWFANNAKVVATGMNVTAQVEGGIQIKTVSSTGTLGSGYTADYATTADAKIDSTALLPVSNAGSSAANSVITSDWYYAKAALASAATAKPDTYVTLGNSSTEGQWTFVNGTASGNGVLDYGSTYTGAKDAPAGRYYLATSYNISNVSSAKPASNLKVEGVSVTGTSSTGSENLDKSLRVAVVCGTNVVIYAPVAYASDFNMSVATSTLGTPGAAGTATMGTDNVATKAGTTTSDAIAPSVGDEGSDTLVNVYIWYEGEDSNHMTDNIKATIDGLKITVNFVAEV